MSCYVTMVVSWMSLAHVTSPLFKLWQHVACSRGHNNLFLFFFWYTWPNSSLLWLCSFSKTTSEWISYSHPKVKISTYFYVLSWFLRIDLLYCIFAAYIYELSNGYESSLCQRFIIHCVRMTIWSLPYFLGDDFHVWCVHVCTSVFYSNPSSISLSKLTLVWFLWLTHCFFLLTYPDSAVE